jgi:hypothetical protein
MFAWLSTFGGFALMVVYFLLSIGAYRGLREGTNYVGIVIAATVGWIIAALAVFGGIYKQVNPFSLVWVWVLAWAILGLIVTLLMKGRPPASGVLDDLRSDEEAGINPAGVRAEGIG